MEQLFDRYLDICNDAILKNHARFPFAQIWNAAEVFTRKLQVEVHVHNGSAQQTFHMILKDGILSLMPQTCCGCVKCYGDLTVWHIDAAYLEMVVNHRELYIDQPALLDWSWLMPDHHLSAQGNPELQAEQANAAS